MSRHKPLAGYLLRSWLHLRPCSTSLSPLYGLSNGIRYTPSILRGSALLGLLCIDNVAEDLVQRVLQRGHVAAARLACHVGRGGRRAPRCDGRGVRRLPGLRGHRGACRVSHERRGDLILPPREVSIEILARLVGGS